MFERTTLSEFGPPPSEEEDFGVDPREIEALGMPPVEEPDDFEGEPQEATRQGKQQNSKNPKTLVLVGSMN